MIPSSASFFIRSNESIRLSVRSRNHYQIGFNSSCYKSKSDLLYEIMRIECSKEAFFLLERES